MGVVCVCARVRMSRQIARAATRVRDGLAAAPRAGAQFTDKNQSLLSLLLYIEPALVMFVAQLVPHTLLAIAYDLSPRARLHFETAVQGSLHQYLSRDDRHPHSAHLATVTRRLKRRWSYHSMMRCAPLPLRPATVMVFRHCHALLACDYLTYAGLIAGPVTRAAFLTCPPGSGVGVGGSVTSAHVAAVRRDMR